MGMSGNYFRTSESTVDDIRRGAVALSDFIYDKSQKENIVDIDNAWHAIHFTLTGNAYGGEDDNIFSRLVLSGNTLIEGDEEYSAMFISPEDVKALSAALLALKREDFRERFSMEEMLENEIYPVTEDDDEEDFFDYVWDAVEELKEFFEAAAQEGQAVIFYMM